MVDTYTIIKRFEEYVQYFNPYCTSDIEDHEMLKAVLELLKEQETSNTGKARIFQCEKCGYGFDDIFLTDEHNYDIEPNYCPNCGRLVKWE